MRGRVATEGRSARVLALRRVCGRLNCCVESFPDEGPRLLAEPEARSARVGGLAPGSEPGAGRSRGSGARSPLSGAAGEFVRVQPLGAAAAAAAARSGGLSPLAGPRRCPHASY